MRQYDATTDLEPHVDPKSTGDQHTLQELRSLLLGSDQQELQALRERVENLKIRAQDVSEVVAEALRLREAADKNHQLSQVLTPAVERALRESVHKDATVLAEALFPVMGPAIRKSIYESIRALIRSFNEALSQGLSIRGLKWRIESVRTGRPFAEIVLLHTLVFRVEQIFLIHRKTGLLLHHLASAQLAIEDPDMVSAMLSAIRNFVHDSFSGPQEASVDEMQVGDLQVWVEQGPEAILASVIRGHAPQRIRFQMKELLERVHRRFSQELVAFNGNAYPFLPATEILGSALESQLEDEPRIRSRPYMSIIGIGVLILGFVWGVFSLTQAERWNQFVKNLRLEPGIVITSYDRHNGYVYIQGLRDPLASDPAELAIKMGLDPHEAIFRWKAYDSSDYPLVLKRADAYLAPPVGVSIAIHSGTLTVTGASDHDWVSKVQTLGPLIPGVRKVDTTRLKDLGPVGEETMDLKSHLVLFPTGKDAISDDQEREVRRDAKTLLRFLAKARKRHQEVIVDLIGHTDSTGAEGLNRMLSRERARKVRTALISLGVPANSLRSWGVSNSEPVRRKEVTADDRQQNRSVTFQIVLPSYANHLED